MLKIQAKKNVISQLKCWKDTVQHTTNLSESETTQAIHALIDSMLVLLGEEQEIIETNWG